MSASGEVSVLRHGKIDDWYVGQPIETPDYMLGFLEKDEVLGSLRKFIRAFVLP